MIDKIHPSRDGAVRKILIQMISTLKFVDTGTGLSVLDRPVHTLILVHEWSDLQLASDS